MSGTHDDEAGQLALMPELARARARAREARERTTAAGKAPKPVVPAAENPVEIGRAHV